MSSASTSVHQVASRVGSASDGVGQADLGQLQAPVAVLAPDRLVEEAGHLAERVVGHGRVDGRRRRRGARQRSSARPGPRCAASGRRRSAPAGIVGGPCAEHEARRVPELVGEVAGVLELGGPKRWSLPGRRAVDEGEAQGVGADLVDRRQRVDDVALRLGHLLAVRVADQARQVDRVEGGSPVSSSPSIIIRATQKKMMS